MNFKITFPPYPPPIPHCPAGIGRHFAHIGFSEGFKYGLIVPDTVMRLLTLRTQPELAEWLLDFINDNIIPHIDDWGKTNRLLTLMPNSIQGSPPIIAEVTPYVPVPEKRRFKLSQAIVFFYFPPIWIESSPVKKDGNLDFEAMQAEIYRRQLERSKIKIAATRDGQFTFDFSDWRKNEVPAEVVSSDPLGETQHKRFRAQGIWLSIINVFLTCLQSASFSMHKYIHAPMQITPQRIHLTFCPTTSVYNRILSLHFYSHWEYIRRYYRL